MKVFLITVLTALAFYQFGFWGAHLTVASECEKLGSFYVGKKVFKCELEKTVEDPVSTISTPTPKN